MEVRKISKEELGAKVLFPRTQLKGIDCKDADQMPKRQDFEIEVKHDVPGMGNVKLIVCREEPKMMFQIIETKSEAQFDSHLGTLMGMHESPIYIEGRTDFIIVFQGCKGKLGATQENYKEKVALIHSVRDQAARWWHLYGNEK